MSEEAQQEASQVPTIVDYPVAPAPRMSSQPRSGNSGALVGMLLGAGIATIGMTVPGIIALLKRTQKKGATPVQGVTESAAPPVHQLQLRPFGSPVDRLAISIHSAEAPGTPTMKQVESDTSGAARKDQEPQVAGGDTATLQKQLQLLKAMEEENTKLRAFMMEHMQTSAKVTALEDENKKLTSMKEKLETELGELKARPFIVSTGDELQTFKGMLAARLPLEARSVCSDAEGLAGARGDAASVDGAATVAGFAAVSKRNPGFLNELAQLFMLSAPSGGAKAKMSRNSSVAAIKETSNTGTPLGATSPIPSSRKTAGVAASDVGQLLDAWTGRL